MASSSSAGSDRSRSQLAGLNADELFVRLEKDVSGVRALTTELENLLDVGKRTHLMNMEQLRVHVKQHRELMARVTNQRSTLAELERAMSKRQATCLRKQPKARILRRHPELALPSVENELKLLKKGLRPAGDMLETCNKLRGFLDMSMSQVCESRSADLGYLPADVWLEQPGEVQLVPAYSYTGVDQVATGRRFVRRGRKVVDRQTQVVQQLFVFSLRQSDYKRSSRAIEQRKSATLKEVDSAVEEEEVFEEEELNCGFEDNGKVVSQAEASTQTVTFDCSHQRLCADCGRIAAPGSNGCAGRPLVECESGCHVRYCLPPKASGQHSSNKSGHDHGAVNEHEIEAQQPCAREEKVVNEKTKASEEKVVEEKTKALEETVVDEKTKVDIKDQWPSSKNEEAPAAVADGNSNHGNSECIMGNSATDEKISNGMCVTKESELSDTKETAFSSEQDIASLIHEKLIEASQKCIDILHQSVVSRQEQTREKDQQPNSSSGSFSSNCNAKGQIEPCNYDEKPLPNPDTEKLNKTVARSEEFRKGDRLEKICEQPLSVDSSEGNRTSDGDSESCQSSPGKGHDKEERCGEKRTDVCSEKMVEGYCADEQCTPQSESDRMTEKGPTRGERSTFLEELIEEGASNGIDHSVAELQIVQLAIWKLRSIESRYLADLPCNHPQDDSDIDVSRDHQQKAPAVKTALADSSLHEEAVGECSESSRKGEIVSDVEIGTQDTVVTMDTDSSHLKMSPPQISSCGHSENYAGTDGLGSNSAAPSRGDVAKSMKFTLASLANGEQVPQGTKELEETVSEWKHTQVTENVCEEEEVAESNKLPKDCEEAVYCKHTETAAPTPLERRNFTKTASDGKPVQPSHAAAGFIEEEKLVPEISGHTSEPDCLPCRVGAGERSECRPGTAAGGSVTVSGGYGNQPNSEQQDTNIQTAHFNGTVSGDFTYSCDCKQLKEKNVELEMSLVSSDRNEAGADSENNPRTRKSNSSEESLPVDRRLVAVGPTEEEIDMELLSDNESDEVEYECEKTPGVHVLKTMAKSFALMMYDMAQKKQKKKTAPVEVQTEETSAVDCGNEISRPVDGSTALETNTCASVEEEALSCTDLRIVSSADSPSTTSEPSSECLTMDTATDCPSAESCSDSQVSPLETSRLFARQPVAVAVIPGDYMMRALVRASKGHGYDSPEDSAANIKVALENIARRYRHPVRTIDFLKDAGFLRTMQGSVRPEPTVCSLYVDDQHIATNTLELITDFDCGSPILRARIMRRKCIVRRDVQHFITIYLTGCSET